MRVVAGALRAASFAYRLASLGLSGENVYCGWKTHYLW
jgi:hypothetical protein